MAKKLFKVKALVNIKYDKTEATVGTEFKARKDDLDELVNNGYVELLEEAKDDDASKDGEGSKDDDGAGEKEGEE